MSPAFGNAHLASSESFAPTVRLDLFRVSGPLTLAKPHAWAAAVLTDELNSCFLESGLDLFNSCLSPPKPALRRFQALYGWKGNFRSRR
jgi:hypothetical protein